MKKQKNVTLPRPDNSISGNFLKSSDSIIVRGDFVPVLNNNGSHLIFEQPLFFEQTEKYASDIVNLLVDCLSINPDSVTTYRFIEHCTDRSGLEYGHVIKSSSTWPSEAADLAFNYLDNLVNQRSVGSYVSSANFSDDIKDKVDIFTKSRLTADGGKDLISCFSVHFQGKSFSLSGRLKEKPIEAIGLTEKISLIGEIDGFLRQPRVTKILVGKKRKSITLKFDVDKDLPSLKNSACDNKKYIFLIDKKHTGGGSFEFTLIDFETIDSHNDETQTERDLLTDLDQKNQCK
jgi:hypothetical protein